MELKVNTTCGASNISFGLPNRHGLNSSFLAMAIGAGMTSAITNPLHLEEMIGVMGGDVLMGHDAHCAAWIRKFREPAAEGEGAGGRRGGRENRRRGGGGGSAAGSGTEGVQAAAEPTAQVVNG
jgi:5-methyltetrahydrofolate--homocysteine methyltransferase